MDTTRFDRITALTRRALVGAALAALLARQLLAPVAGAQPLDTDADGLYDEDELAVYGTDPHDYDTDGDGASDGAEVYFGTAPLVAEGYV